MGKYHEEIFEIQVSAYTRIADNKTFYDGLFCDRDNTLGPGLNEYSEKTIQGLFKNLEDLVEAIETGLEEKSENFTPIQRKDTIIHFTNVKDNTFKDAYFSSWGSYLQRTLNESELKELLSLTDSKLRAKLYEE